MNEQLFLVASSQAEVEGQYKENFWRKVSGKEPLHGYKATELPIVVPQCKDGCTIKECTSLNNVPTPCSMHYIFKVWVAGNTAPLVLQNVSKLEHYPCERATLVAVVNDDNTSVAYAVLQKLKEECVATSYEDLIELCENNA